MIPKPDAHQEMRESLRDLCSRFPAEYHRRLDADGAYPSEFVEALTAAGWLAAMVPEEYGGSGLGVTEAATMMHEVASHGGGMSATSAVHINLFGPHPIVVKGTPEQKARWVPRLVAGEDQCCFGFTEPRPAASTAARLT